MSKMLFDNLLQKKDGLIKGPFGGDIKKSLFVTKTDDAYKVYEQGVVLKNDVQFGDYYISKEHFEKSLKRFEVKSGDILMTGAGTLGKLFFVPKVHPKGVINQALLRIRLNESIIIPSFFKYYFKFYIEAIISRLNSDSVIPNLPPLPIIKSTEIDIPDVFTQKSIAKVLSDLDAKIELNNRINRELEAMAKTLYDYWFVQFDFPNEQGKPYKSSGGKMVYNKELKREIPEGWEVKKLSEIATTGSGGTPLSTKKEFYENGNIPWINSGEVNMPFIVSTKNYITQKGLENSSAKMFKRGTILMAMYGATAGKVSFMDIEACTNQAICAINPKEDSYRIFIKLVLEDLYKYLINLSSGSARDNLSQDKIRELKFVIPSKSLIQKFDKIVQSSMNKILINLKQNQQLSELRDWLLPMLMNGQVTVRQAHGNAVKETNEVSTEIEKQIINLSKQQEERFELWLTHQGIAARGDLDKKTLRDIFDAMDDEDK